MNSEQLNVRARVLSPGVICCLSKVIEQYKHHLVKELGFCKEGSVEQELWNWCQSAGSTIFVLTSVLQRLGLQDCVEQISMDIELNLMHLHVVLEGAAGLVGQSTPAMTQTAQFRPLVTNGTFSLRQALDGYLDCSGDPAQYYSIVGPSNWVTWDTPAARLRGQQLTLQYNGRTHFSFSNHSAPPSSSHLRDVGDGGDINIEFGQLYNTEPKQLYSTQPMVHSTDLKQLHSTDPKQLHSTERKQLHSTELKQGNNTKGKQFHSTEPTDLHSTELKVYHATEHKQTMSTEQKDVLSTEPKQLNSTNLHKSFDSLTFEKKFVRPEISLQGEDFQSQTIPKEIADEIKDEEVSMAGGQPKYDIPDSIVTHAPRTFEILTPDSLHENSFFSSMNQTHISAATTNDKQSIYTGNIQQGIQDNKPLRDKCVNGNGGQAPALYLSLPAWQAHRLKNFRESNLPNFSFIDSPSTNRSFEESYEHMETKLQNKSRQNDLNYSMAPSTQPCLSVRNHLDSPDEDSRHIAERQRASPAQMSPDWDKSLSNNQILEDFEEANKDQIRVFIVEEEKVENKSPGRTAGKQGIDVMETEFDGIECARGITQTFAAQPSNSDMNRKVSESHEPPLKRQRSQSRAENNPELEQTDTILADVANELINYEEDNSRSMVAQASSELDSDMPLNNIPDHPSAASSSTSLHPPMGYYTRYTPPPPFLENTSEGESQTPTDPLAPQVSPPPYDQITQQFTSEGLHANTYIPNGHANFISTRQSIVGSPPNLSGRHAHFAGFSQPQTGSSSNNCSSSEPDRTNKPQTHNLLQDTALAQANGQYINMEQSATSKHVTHASNTTSCVTHRSPPLPDRIMSPQRQLNQIKQQPRVTLPGTLTASNPPRRSMPQPFQPAPYLIPVGVVGQSPPSDPHYINPDLERGCFQLGFRPQNSRRLQDELRQLHGWCPNVNGSNINEAIKNIVHGDGNFIIWRSRRHNNFVITLSHHGHPIYLRVREAPPRSRGGGPVYYLYEDEFHSESILALVQHYRERGVHVKIIAQHSGRSHIEHIRLRRPLQF